MVPLSEDQLSPRVLSAFGFQGKSFASPLSTRQVADFEFEFVTEGGGSQLIDGVTYPMVAGDLVWRRPGSVTRGLLPYSTLTVILDLEGVLRPSREPYLVHRPKWAQPDFRPSALEGLGPVLTPSEPDEYRRLFASLVNHFVNPGPGSQLYLRALSLELLAGLATEARVPDQAAVLPAGTSLRLRRLTAFLRKNFARRLALDDLAREAGLSPTYLHSLFTGALGITPREYLTRLRLGRARELLAATPLSAADVARECGFENVPYFFTLFRRRTGLTPKAFRQRHSPLGQ